MRMKGRRKEMCFQQARKSDKPKVVATGQSQALADKRITEMFLSGKHYTGMIVLWLFTDQE